jgi:hypothetical protein
MPDETQNQSTEQLESPAAGAEPKEAGSAEPADEPGKNEPEHPAEG